MIAGMITNGYLLVAERIERLNRAGLEWLQISIDNVTPDDVSKKSLKVLDKKLELLAQYADFHVNINSVVGGGVRIRRTRSPSQARTGAGFHLNHRHHSRWLGPVQPLNDEERHIYHEMKSMEKSSFTRINGFQDNIADGRPNQWRCRAGPAIYTFVKMAWCTTARSSAATRQFLWRSTRPKTFAANICRKDVRSQLHGFVRSPGLCVRFLARSAVLAPAAVSSNASGLVQIE